MKEYNRRDFLKNSLLGLSALSCGLNLQCHSTDQKRPNVILVMTDDQGYGDLHCLGNEMIKTPNLDKLHKQSIRLTNFHVSPTCAPTRASLLTGRYSNATGVWHTIMGRSLLHPEEVTIADCFKATGYKTGIFGKWHLGDNYPCRPQDNGFDEVLVHGGGGVWQTPDYFGNDYFDDTYFHNGKPQKYYGYCTDVWFKNALNFIDESQKKNQPFFCYLPTNAAHWPFWVEDEYADLYRNNDKVPNPEFYGMITNFDKNLGKLMSFLKEKGLEENTLLIFMTDNGSTFGVRNGKGFNANMRGQKGSEYEGGHRVPCFVYWPDGNLVGPKDIDQLTSHTDWLPTLVDLCNLKKIKGPEIHGKSIKPLLKNNEEHWQDRTIVVDSQRLENLVKWRKCSVMSQQWRLVNGKELYDIKKDPSQKHDVAKQYPKIVEILRQDYNKWWEKTSQRKDEFVHIILGNKAENPSCLTCHDWHGEGSTKVWNQNGIRNAPPVNGFWTVEVEMEGNYKFELRRWPVELNKGIREVIPTQKVSLGTDSLPIGKDIKVKKARLKIADLDFEKPVHQKAKGVSFQVGLKKGKTKLQTWFTDDRGESFGAYYVYVKRL